MFRTLIFCAFIFFNVVEAQVITNKVDYDRLTELLLENKASYFYAIDKDDWEVAQILVDFGSDVNKLGVFKYCKMTPLEYASGHKKIDFVNFFIQHGADVNVGSPLYHLIVSSHIEPRMQSVIPIAKILIENGADVNKVISNISLLSQVTNITVPNKNPGMIPKLKMDLTKLLLENGARL